MKSNISIQKLNRNLKVGILLLLSFISGGALAQITVEGTVTDADNIPLPGVNILIQGSQKGTVTNVTGHYTIEVPGPETVLLFSFIGYHQQEIQVGDQRTIDVVLTEDTKALEEVVVIGYGKQKKIDLSGSVAVVDMDELEDLPITSAGEALKGRAAGVFVSSNSGQPGSDPSILIRGKSSLTAGNAPLVVVDGVPGANLGDVDFRDVVSMTVLKDAASAAIYGSSGANGVILITTKRGQSGKTQIEFKSYFEWKTPPEKIDVLNSEQAFDLMMEIDQESDEAKPYLGTEYITNMMIDTTNLVNTDWQDQLFREVAPTQSYALSFSGGNEVMAYRISGSYLNNVGYIRPSENERFTLRSNLDFKFSDKLRMVTDFALARENRLNVSTGDFAWNGTSMLTALNTLPFIPIYADDNSFFVNPFQPNIDVPNAGIADNNSNIYGTRLQGRYGLYYEILDGLSFTFELMPSISLNKSDSYTSKYYTYIGRSVGGRANSGSSESMKLDVNNYLTYEKSLGDHNFSLMGGYVIQKANGYSVSANASGFPTDSIPHIVNAVKTNGGSGRSEYSKYSYISRLNYNYMQKYYIQLNVRADGSSRFGPNYRWGTFPSASFAWRISEESFMDNLELIEELKLRGTIGVTGNDQFANYLFISTYQSGANYPIWGTDDVAPGFVPASLYNPNLKWEEQYEQTLGVDLSLWNGRLQFSGEVYQKSSYDLLYNSKPPVESGFTSGWVNIGEVESKGYDLMLTTRNLSSRDMSWITSITFSGNDTKVVSLGELEESQFQGRDNEYIITPGEYIDAFYGWRTEGIFQTQEQIDNLNTVAPDGSIIYYQNENTAPGDIIFQNLNGYERDEEGNLLLDIDGNPYTVINEKDRQVIGKPHPDFFFGIDNTFRYKDFELSIFLQGVYGNDILSLTRREIERMDHYFNYSATTLNRWQYEGQDTDIPRPTTSDPNENNRISDRWLEDGSYLRFKYVTLGYNLSPRLLENIGLERARVYITANNLLTFTNYSLYDPEIATNGRGEDMGGYPQARSYMIGFSLGF